jgi:hypothetical protein
MPEPDPAVTAVLVRAHQEARAALAGVGGVRSGWTVANLNAHGVGDGGAQLASEWGRLREDRYLAAAAEDDFVGVQVYTRTMIGPSGQVVPVGAEVRQTLTGWEFYPAALGEAVRHTADVVPGSADRVGVAEIEPAGSVGSQDPASFREELNQRCDLAQAMIIRGDLDEAHSHAQRARQLALRVGSVRQRRRIERLTSGSGLDIHRIVRRADVS